jgi:serine/threonine protein kinase
MERKSDFFREDKTKKGDAQRIAKWVDRIEAGSDLHPTDYSDREACKELIASIPCRAGTSEPLREGSLPFVQRFTGIRLIGHGAYGVVFSALDGDRGNQEVAFKILRPSLKSDAVARRRMESEAKVVAELQHPSILAMLESGVVDKLPYLVNEFANGGSLADAMAGIAARWSPRQAASLGLQVAKALWVAHSKLILHRDIKPGNILLRQAATSATEGIGLEPLLCDFGLAKAVEDPNTTALTRDGEILGTVAYMSPEQVLGESLQLPSDQFSLGVVLHELVYGVHPFRDASAFATRSRILSEEPIKVGGYGGRVPKPLQRVIEKCLAKSPSDRYRTISQLVDDLHSFLQGKSISIPAPTPWRTLQRFASLHPIGATFLATLLASLLAMVFLLNREWTIQKQLTKQAEELAEARAKVSSLFLDSMRRTNSGMNDTILSGQRVLPDDLLKSLEEQLPLLEEASRLDPNDFQLLRHLQILLHYCALCYHIQASDVAIPRPLESARKAIAMRARSLELIDRLLEKFPENQAYQVSRINGAYWMNVHHQTIGDFAGQAHWNQVARGYLDEHLKKHPDDLEMQETANALRLSAAESVGEAAPEESLRLLDQVADSSLDLLKSNPDKQTLVVYAAKARTYMGSMLMAGGSRDQATNAFEEAEELLTRPPHGGMAWDKSDTLLWHYMARCIAYLKAGDPDLVLSVQERWDRLLQQSPTWENPQTLQGLWQSVGTHQLLCHYLGWLAMDKLRGRSSVEEVHAKEIAQRTLRNCMSDPEVNIEQFVQGLRQESVSVEPIESWIAEARSAK